MGYGGGRNRELKHDADVNRHAGNEALTIAVLLTGLPGNLASRRQQAHFGVMRTRLEVRVWGFPKSGGAVYSPVFDYTKEVHYIRHTRAVLSLTRL